MVQIPEHTWGFDTKTFLHDNANWSNAQFQGQLEAHANNYEANIAQWQRQRGYMSWALEALGMSTGAASAKPLVAVCSSFCIQSYTDIQGAEYCFGINVQACLQVHLPAKPLLVVCSSFHRKITGCSWSRGWLWHHRRGMKVAWKFNGCKLCLVL